MPYLTDVLSDILFNEGVSFYHPCLIVEYPVIFLIAILNCIQNQKVRKDKTTLF